MDAPPASGPVLLAIDQGTTGTKALLLDAELRVLAETATEFPQHFPAPGQVEHEPDEIWQSVRTSVEESLTASGIRPEQIVGIGITNQRETTVLWDRASGRPLHRAIVWQDRRTAPLCASLRDAGHDELFRQRTGLVIDPYFSATKIAWILEQVDGARRSALAGDALFGTIDTWLAWRLTAGAAHVTDVSNASRTLLCRLEAGSWDEELLSILDIPAAILPRIVGNDEILGTTKGLDFLPDGIPVATLVGDQQAALFGQACFEPGAMKCTYGTGAFLVRNTGPNLVPSGHGLLTTAAWRLGGRTTFALEGSCFVAGAIVQWIRDGLGWIESSEEIETLARSVPDSGGVVLVPALAGLGAPHWLADARGVISGLTRGTTAAHVARAALEGMALQVRDVVGAMEEDTGQPATGLRVDGGASRNDLLMQLQADLLDIAVVRPRNPSTTALGAALLAGLATGVFGSLEEIRNSWQEERRFDPTMGREERAGHLRRWRRGIRQACILDEPLEGPPLDGPE